MRISSFAYCPIGRTVAIGVAGIDSRRSRLVSEVKLWDVESGKQEQSIRRMTLPMFGPQDIVTNFAAILKMSVEHLLYSPDGKLLVISTPEETQLWDTGSGRLLHTFRDSYLSLAISPDGQILATASGSLWDTASGSLRRKLAGIRSSRDVELIAFSPDGKQIAGSSTREGTVRFWDAESGRLLGTLMIACIRIDAHGQPVSEWLLRTPEGYYDGPPGVEQFIRWRVGDRLVPASQYKRTFHRPDLVRMALHGKPLPEPGSAPNEVQ